MPMEGKLKPPNTPDNPRVHPAMKAAGAAVGIDFTGACDVAPNTIRAHILLDLVKDQPAIQDNVADKIFYAYFTAGKNVNGLDELVHIGQESGLDGDAVRGALQDESTIKRIREECAQASGMGISGVPYFFFNGRPGFSGAQGPEAFVSAFAQATNSES
mmetsp:Transcript_3791/g.5741  ORF Transcript_3791/g.5741 Transcript_3791/m.5741 type:complete len:159 (-) Transcript_3791:264-740(-)